jgi:LacI family transcriptional regulator
VECFLGLNFRRFAFFGARGPKWSQARLRHFRRLLEERGNTVDHLLLPMVKDMFEDDHAELEAWLQQLPRPVAIWASDDRAGLRLTNACLQLGLRVPEEMAVLGVDNDEIICGFASPPLSSIELDGVGAGYRAAQLLDCLMHGDALPGQLLTPLAPRGIVHRRSTDVQAIADPHVALAMRLIHAEACQGVHVADIVRRIPLARRPLENRFKTMLGRTMREEIWRVQFDRAKCLLRDTELPLRSIAEECGFEHVEYFSAAFKKFVGEAPGRFRLSSKGLC